VDYTVNWLWRVNAVRAGVGGFYTLVFLVNCRGVQPGGNVDARDWTIAR
jgi:hypothetical protein